MEKGKKILSKQKKVEAGSVTPQGRYGASDAWRSQCCGDKSLALVETRQYILGHISREPDGRSQAETRSALALRLLSVIVQSA
jgi:hypothetical protein